MCIYGELYVTGLRNRYFTVQYPFLYDSPTVTWSLNVMTFYLMTLFSWRCILRTWTDSMMSGQSHFPINVCKFLKFSYIYVYKRMCKIFFFITLLFGCWILHQWIIPFPIFPSNTFKMVEKLFVRSLSIVLSSQDLYVWTL